MNKISFLANNETYIPTGTSRYKIEYTKLKWVYKNFVFKIV